MVDPPPSGAGLSRPLPAQGRDGQRQERPVTGAEPEKNAFWSVVDPHPTRGCRRIQKILKYLESLHRTLEER